MVRIICLILEVKFKEDSLSIFDNLNTFSLSLLHEETSEIWKKYFVGCYIPWLKDGISAVTNVGIETSMYIQIIVLVRAAFFQREFKQSSFIKKKTNKHRKTFLKNVCFNVCTDITSLPSLMSKRYHWHNLFLPCIPILLDPPPPPKCQHNNWVPPQYI